MKNVNTLKVTGIINGYLVNYSYSLASFSREFGFFDTTILFSIEEALSYRIALTLNDRGDDGFNVTVVSSEDNRVVGIVYDRTYFLEEEEDNYFTYSSDLEYYFEDDGQLYYEMSSKINNAITKAYNNIIKELGRV